MLLSEPHNDNVWPLAERQDAPGALRSPNIWDAPDTYEVENLGPDRAGRIEARIRELGGWAGADVLDIGCGTGFHLPRFAVDARSVVGVEPHEPLLRRARARVAAAGLGEVSVRLASAQATGLPEASVDVAHARWAYFFGPGCEPGLVELERVMRPGGTAYVIDCDATRSTFGRWFRQAWPTYDALAVERFWRRRGWAQERVTIAWEYDRRADFEAVVRLEFTPEYAVGLLAEDPHRTGVDYAVNLWWRRF
ncbi:MAG: class I SAM-dependent methyltransferase [Dermatophilaceae bacterium]